MSDAVRNTAGNGATEISYTPTLPSGRHIDLGERGRTFIREVAGPPGAPTLLLLHGWTASADLNWFRSFERLGRSFSVVAMDHRGHGRGIRSRRRFRLADCAHDAAALVAHLGTGPVIVVGYSMGGPVAMLLWREHPEAVGGLVLCATARTFALSGPEKAGAAALASLAMASRATPGVARRALAERLIGARQENRSIDAWVTNEMHRNDWTSVLEAGTALGRFDSRRWIATVDVPTAVVVTMGDRLVSPARQIALARSVPGATLHPVQADHSACVSAADRFVPVLLDACTSVAGRMAPIRSTPAPPPGPP